MKIKREKANWEWPATIVEAGARDGDALRQTTLDVDGTRQDRWVFNMEEAMADLKGAISTQ